MKGKGKKKKSSIFCFCTNVSKPFFLLYHDNSFSLFNIYYLTMGKKPNNTILSFGFPSLSVLPYVHFSASSQRSILLPKATSLPQSFVSVTITKQGLKVGKLAKVAATSLISYRLCTFVWILCQKLAGTGWHDATCGTGYHFSEINKKTFCNRSKKHKHNLESPNIDLAWPLHLMLCNYNTLFPNVSFSPNYSIE